MRLARVHAVPAVLVSLFVAAGAGCSTGADESASSVGSDGSESALRALATDEILGDLHFGDTSAPVDYTETPLYRAFRVQANAGDTIDAWVRSSTGGDARAWILSPTYATLALNDNGDSSTLDAHVVKKVMSAGAYFVVFRDKNREDNTFTVSLAASTSGGGTGGSDGGAGGGDAGGGGGGGGGSTSVDPFDDSLLTGTAMSASDAKGFFAAGASSATLGGFAMAQRTRTCNATTGCTAWTRNDGVTFAYDTYEWWNPGPGWSNQKDCFQFKPETFTKVEGTLSLSVDASGQFALGLTSSPTGTVSCANVTAGKASCGGFASSGVSQPTGGAACNLPNDMGSGFDATVYPSSVALFDSGTTTSNVSQLAMSVLVTHDHVYGRASYQGKPDASGTHTETDYALYGLTTPGSKPDISGGGSACVPTTCAAQHKTCGTISDGCGGTISCGGCDYPYTCGSDNTCQVPPGCNLQPCYAGASVAYTCCGSNQVTCSNGQGCTCYDACN